MPLLLMKSMSQADAKNEISRFVKTAGEEDKKIMEELKEREKQ